MHDIKWKIHPSPCTKRTTDCITFKCVFCKSCLFNNIHYLKLRSHLFSPCSISLSPEAGDLPHQKLVLSTSYPELNVFSPLSTLLFPRNIGHTLQYRGPGTWIEDDKRFGGSPPCLMFCFTHFSSRCWVQKLIALMLFSRQIYPACSKWYVIRETRYPTLKSRLMCTKQVTAEKQGGLERGCQEGRAGQLGHPWGGSWDLVLCHHCWWAEPGDVINLPKFTK